MKEAIYEQPKNNQSQKGLLLEWGFYSSTLNAARLTSLSRENASYDKFIIKN